MRARLEELDSYFKVRDAQRLRRVGAAMIADILYKPVADESEEKGAASPVPVRALKSSYGGSRLKP